MQTTLLNPHQHVVTKEHHTRRSKRPASLMLLPPEIRQQIYEFTWDRRTIVLCYEEKLECPGKPPRSYRYDPMANNSISRMGEVERKQRDLYKSCPEYQTERGMHFDAPEQGIHTFTTYSYKPLPDTLAINRDSRAITLRYYKPVFAMHSMHMYTGCFHRDPGNFRYNTYVYFNFSLDVLLIPFPSLWDFSVVDRLRFCDLSQLRYVQLRIWDPRQGMLTGLPVDRVKVFPLEWKPSHVFKVDMGPVSTSRKMHHLGKPNTRPKRQSYVQQFEAQKERMNGAAQRDTTDADAETETEADEESESRDGEDAGHMNNGDWSPMPLYYDFSPSLPTHGEIDDTNLERGPQLPLKRICNRVQEISCTFGQSMKENGIGLCVARFVTAAETERTVAEMTEKIIENQEKLDEIVRTTQDMAKKNTMKSQANPDNIMAEMTADFTEKTATEWASLADWHRRMICPPIPDNTTEEYIRDFVDDRLHLQIKLGPEYKGLLFCRKLFEWLVSWFPLKEGSDEKGPDRQDGFHWSCPRTADGWVHAVPSFNSYKYKSEHVKKHYGSIRERGQK